MRKQRTLLFLIAVFSLAFAGQTIHFHQGSSSESYDLNESDSLYFDDSQTLLYFYNNGNTLQFTAANIDSITFTEDISENIYIDYQGNSVSVINPFSNNGVTVDTDGADVTVTAEADTKDITYICSGTTSNGSLKIYSDKKFNLILNGLNLTNPVGPAINIQSEKSATVHLPFGTNNALTDGTAYDDPPVIGGEEEDQKATFFSECKLTFTGAGSLAVNSLGDDQHAICSDEEVIV